MCFHLQQNEPRVVKSLEYCFDKNGMTEMLRQLHSVSLTLKLSKLIACVNVFWQSWGKISCIIYKKNSLNNCSIFSGSNCGLEGRLPFALDFFPVSECAAISSRVKDWDMKSCSMRCGVFAQDWNTLRESCNEIPVKLVNKLNKRLPKQHCW